MHRILAAAAFSAMTIASPAAAATTIFSEDFEKVPKASGVGTVGDSGGKGFTFVKEAGPWTEGPDPKNEIELQWGGIAGAPAENGGNVFVELDTDGNSSMFYTLTSTGMFKLDFLFSPRPEVTNMSNLVELWLDGELLGSFNGPGSGTNGSTVWTQESRTFKAKAGQNLIFKAGGTSESLGGYIDNTVLSAVPEPGTWLLMIMGLGAVGFAMRSNRKSAVRLNFA